MSTTSVCLVFTLIVVGVAWATATTGGTVPPRVLLRAVSALTFRHGTLTAGRRSSPVPQLRCLPSGSYGCPVEPQFATAQCTNSGHDGFDVVWQCTTSDMTVNARLGRVNVNCEGYDYADDPYVLNGSCALEYELDLTDEGRKAKHQQWQRVSQSFPPEAPRQQSKASDDENAFLGVVLLLFTVGISAALVYLMCDAFSACNRSLQTHRLRSERVHVNNAIHDPPYRATNVYVTHPVGDSWGWYSAMNASSAADSARRAERAAAAASSNAWSSSYNSNGSSIGGGGGDKTYKSTSFGGTTRR